MSIFRSPRHSNGDQFGNLVLVVILVIFGFLELCKNYPTFVWSVIGLIALWALIGEIKRFTRPVSPKLELVNNRTALTLAFQLAGYINEKSSSNKQLKDLYLDRTCTQMELPSFQWNAARIAFEQGRVTSDEFILTAISSSLHAGLSDRAIEAIFLVAMGPIFFDKLITYDEFLTYEKTASWLGIDAAKSKKIFDRMREKYGFKKMGDGTYFSEGNSFEGFFNNSNSGEKHEERRESSQEETDSPSNGIIDERAARTLLGVSSGASQKEVRRAYKKLMMANHPDRAAAQGWDEDEIAKRTAISQKIQAAWETVCKSKGW